MALEASAAFLPVTALAFWDLGATQAGGGEDGAARPPPVLLMAGAGADVRSYGLQRGEKGPGGDAAGAAWDLVAAQSVLPSAVVHGIRPEPHEHAPAPTAARCVVFGHRRAKICSWEFPAGLVPEASLEGIGDLVWDASWVGGDRLALGTAQGFVEIFSENRADQTWTRSHRVLCTARCILYSFAFSPVVDASQILVASGTVFGEIVLWAGASTDGEPLQRLEGHHGPVFRVSWSDDAQQLCSVGDDRTVRVWSAQGPGTADFAQIWKAFGHNARIWDCAFVPSLDAVATVGEDRQVRVWAAADGTPLALFEAHFGRHIWRCALLNPGHGACVLATAGGDSAVNVFDLHREVTSRADMRALLRCSSSSSSSIKSSNEQQALASPLEEGEEDQRKRPRKGPQVSVALIHHVAGHPRRAVQLLVLTSEGGIFALDGALDAAPWVPLYTPGASGDSFKPFVIHHMAGSSDVFVGTRKGCVILFRDASGTFDTKDGLARVATISVFENPVASVAQLLTCEDGDALVATPSGSGAIRVWNVVEKNLVLAPRFTTEAQAARVAVYTCAEELPALKTVVLGDSRGSLHWTSLLEGKQGVRSLTRAHGTCKVACLKVRNGALYSGGHNCTIVKFQPCVQDGVVVALEAVCVVRLAHVLDQINDLTWTAGRGDLVAAGFQYTDFVVWNTRTHTPLLRDRCGGWRRPGAVALAAEPFERCAMFYTESAHERRERGAGPEDLAIHRVGRLASATGLAAGAGATLGQVFHSRSIWVAQWLPQAAGPYCMVGCEDGLLSLVRMEGPGKARVLAQRQRERSVRCACILDGGIPAHPVVLVTGSSNQVLRAWHVDPAAAQRSDDDGLVLLAETLPVDEADADGGGETTEETDGVAASHRVLGLFGHGNLVVVGTSTGQLVVYELLVRAPRALKFADANGDDRDDNEAEVAQLKSRYEARVPLKGRFVQLQELAPAATSATSDDASTMAKPVRCLRGHYVPANDTLWLFVGRTNGVVEIWRGADGGRGDWKQEFAELLHTMGVNCIDVAALADGVILVVSGSDDQSLTVLRWSTETARSVGQCLRVLEADASALRGVYTDGALVWSCGLNQRLRRWRLRLGADSVQLDAADSSKSNFEVVKVRPHEESSTVIELEDELLVDVADVNCLSVQANAAQGDAASPIIVGGVGVRIFCSQ